MKKLKLWMAAMVFAGSVGGSFVSVAVPQTANAASCQDNVLLFPTWYRGLGTNTTDAAGQPSCEIMSPGSGPDSLGKFIWTIVMNVIGIALVAVGYISVGFIIYGGFLYLTGGGSADKIAGARKTILNAVIGLIISFFSVIIVNIVVSRF